jgi:hypothetical protein
MYPMRFSRGTNLNVMRVLILLRERKCLKKVPNKTIEYYIGDSTAHLKKAHFQPRRITR